MPFKDPEKQAEYHRVYYEKNRRNRKEKIRQYTKSSRERNRAFVREHLEAHPCVDCGESDPIVLEFDHVRGEKRNDVANLVNRAVSIMTLQEEIKKCDVRCANCHRRITFKRLQE